MFILEAKSNLITENSIMTDPSENAYTRNYPIPQLAIESLNEYDMNKSIMEKELLFMHWQINLFIPYLMEQNLL